MIAQHPRSPATGSERLGALETAYQLFDRPGLCDLVDAHPTLPPLLLRLRAAIRTVMGEGADALVDTVRSVNTGSVVGVVVMVQPPEDAPSRGYERLVAWWQRRASREARGRIALGLLPPRAAANDNASDD